MLGCFPDPGRRGHVQTAGRRHLRLVVHRGPRLTRVPTGAVRLVDNHQVPRTKAATVCALEDAEADGGVRGEHRHPLQTPYPGDEFARIGRARHTVGVVGPKRAHPDHRPCTASFPPRGRGLGQQIQCRHQYQDMPRAEFLGGRDGDQGLPGAGRGDDLGPQPLGRQVSARRCLQDPQNRVDRLHLMRKQLLQCHQNFLSSTASDIFPSQKMPGSLCSNMHFQRQPRHRQSTPGTAAGCRLTLLNVAGHQE
ncbi:hypothetical protein EES42_43925 [Streptomyces sp. ADI95-17]|nr:hypothetical protein EES42_43925 [Streptomyces sp. ADI95-17]